MNGGVRGGLRPENIHGPPADSKSTPRWRSRRRVAFAGR